MAELAKGQSHSWTTENHLVGSSQVRNVLVPALEDGDTYMSSNETIKACLFESENSRERKPALWRGFVRREKRPALAIDNVASDWQPNDENTVEAATKLNFDAVTERLQSLILDRIYTNVLPDLILKAALEEVRAHYLHLATTESKSSQRSSKTHPAANQSPPFYYSRHPNTYLKPPETLDQESSNTVAVQFTPNNLVSRIKAGCALAWSLLEDNRRHLGGSNKGASDRRISSRLAKIMEQKELEQEPTNTDDARYFWGVIPGGTIATFLIDQFMGEENDVQNEDKTCIPNGIHSDDVEMGPQQHDLDNSCEIDQIQVDQDNEEESEDEIDFSKLHNPYLEPSKYAMLEWLGRKTAKMLSSHDLQKVFPLITRQQQPKGKKKNKKSNTEQPTVKRTLDILTSLDRHVWAKVFAPIPGDSLSSSSSSYLVLESLDHQDSSELDQWEMSYFARAHFAIRIISDKTDSESNLKATDYIQKVEKEYKERKSWETMRYKAIHSGFTRWPSWEEAVLEWKNKAVDSDNADGEPATNHIADNYPDMEFAKEDESNQRSSRRGKRRGGDGVFYGSQSGMSLKQIMEALLRMVSQKPLQTISQLISKVPDESTDPMRRMRNALGRLVWKRNQMARLEINTDWTDSPAWRTVLSNQVLSIKGTTDLADEDVSELFRYIHDLQRTELQLRSLVLANLTRLPASTVARAGDERPGSMDAADHASFRDPISIDWLTSGHEHIGKDIFRPPMEFDSVGNASCEWFRIVGYVDSILSDPGEVDTVQDKPQIGTAKENRAVERRARFHAIPKFVAESGDDDSETVHLALTEAQVFAGLKAAEIQDIGISDRNYEEHPFAGDAGSKIEFIPEDQSSPHIHGVVVGWMSSYNEVKDRVEHIILVLPGKGQSRELTFRAILASEESGMNCTIEGSDEVFSVRQFDYHESSDAFQECEAIISHLSRHPKAEPFMEPVDPIALNIPNYHDVITNPMDISTVSKKLQRGDYSHIQPKDANGLTPVSRMLNGQFRKDLELIFDNATTFNPPDDWIYQAAITLKKYILKKIDQVSAAADESVATGRRRPNKGIYVDEDSDVDLYVYESDKDEDYDGPRQSRKRKQEAGIAAEDTSAKAIERAVRLQKVLGDAQGLRGPLSNLPVISNASSFSLPSDWNCEIQTANESNGEKAPAPNELEENLNELVLRRSQVEEKEASGMRRSTRVSTEHRDIDVEPKEQQPSLIYVHHLLTTLGDSGIEAPRNRLEVELFRERLHEQFFAKLYHSLSKNIVANTEANADGGSNSSFVGIFSEESFPPFLGRVTPVASPSFKGEATWEIRTPNIIPAIRWIIRGLISSGHFAEIEPLTADSLQSGVILPNNVYYIDPRVEPFDMLNQEIQRRKRVNQESESSEEEEVELSEYEKQRAERMARNAQLLKSLGLS